MGECAWKRLGANYDAREVESAIQQTIVDIYFDLIDHKLAV
jgi:hypothetical protein